jgi:hypothetical protein
MQYSTVLQKNIFYNHDINIVAHNNKVSKHVENRCLLGCNAIHVQWYEFTAVSVVLTASTITTCETMVNIRINRAQLTSRQSTSYSAPWRTSNPTSTYIRTHNTNIKRTTTYGCYRLVMYHQAYCVAIYRRACNKEIVRILRQLSSIGKIANYYLTHIPLPPTCPNAQSTHRVNHLCLSVLYVILKA